MLDRIKQLSKIQLLSILLIVAGLFLTFRHGLGMVRAYRAMEYAREYGFDTGIPEVDLIQPWMTIRYIAVAYAVPQEYLLSEIDVPVSRENSETPLGRLNFWLGLGTADGEPVLVDMVREAILKYQEDPAPTGLRERGVRPWMTVQYISNSTGIPPEYIFEQIGLPMEGHAFVPLERLSDDVAYQGGLRRLVQRIQQVVDTYEESPQ